nr:hypothetical protein [Tanacetum cinerariifolium]
MVFCLGGKTGVQPRVSDVPSDDSEEEISWNSFDDEDVDDQTKGIYDNEGEKTNESDADDDNDQDEAEKVNDDDDDEEEISKIDDQEATESGEGYDEETKSDRESEEEETTEKEEESFDPIPRTPKKSKDDGNGEKDQGLRISEEERMHEEEEAGELYRMESIFTTGSSFVTPIPSPKSTMTPSIITTTTTASQPPIPPTPIPCDILQTLPTFASVFRFKDRVKSLEVNFSKFMRTYQSLEAVSNIPADLSEMNLKKILIDKMEGNKSIQRLDEQQNLYKALVEAYDADKTILDSYGESAILKRRRKDDDDQEGPSAGSDRGSKRRREGGSMHQPALHLNQLPGVQAGLLQGLNLDSCLPGRIRQQFYRFAVNQESALDVYSKRRIIAVTDLKIVEWHNYKHLDWISVRRDDDKIYKFKEGDFKRLRLQYIEDMLLLFVQGKLSNLTVDERFAFNDSLRMFTRSIVIQRRVEDL